MNKWWNLFKITGKIEYYLKYKEKEGEDELNRSNRDSS